MAKAGSVDQEQGDEAGVAGGQVVCWGGSEGTTDFLPTPQCLKHPRCWNECIKLDVMC